MCVSSAGFEKSVRSRRRALNLATGPDYVSRVDVFVDGNLCKTNEEEEEDPGEGYSHTLKKSLQSAMKLLQIAIA